MGGLRILCAGAIALSAAAPSAAQRVDTRAELAIPRGAAALARVLGLDPATATRARIIVEAARLLYSVPEGPNETARTLVAVKTYFDALDAIDAEDGTIAVDLRRAAADRAAPRILSVLGLTIEGAAPRVVPSAAPAAELQRDTLERGGIEIQPIVDGLNRGERVTIAVTPETAPLPLGADQWKRVLPRKSGDRPLYRAILEDRAASLLYAGLATLDPETLAWIASSRTSVRDLYDRASAFAASSRALRIRAGIVVTPGGDEAAALWETVVGAPTRDPASFIRRLFGGEGRLAYLYDTIGALDAAHQRYALGLWINAEERLDRFHRLADFIAGYDESWKIRQTPFSRPPLDPTLTLLGIRVQPDGKPAAPASRAFWSAILVDGEADLSRRYDLSEDDPADAAWLLGRALDTPVAMRRRRVERMLFVMRLAEQGVRDADALIGAAYGFARFPALMLVLERLPLTDAALFGESARRAASLGPVEGANGATTLALFQGAVAIVDRARFARTLSPDQATALIRSLVALEGSGAGYDGAVAHWMNGTLLPALTGSAAITDTADAILQRAAAGRPPEPPVTIRWEEQTYHVDVAAGEIGRLDRLRRDQHVATVGDVLALAAAVADLRTNDAPVPERVRTALAAIALDRDAPVFQGLRDALRDVQASARDGRLFGRDRARLVRLADRLLAFSMLTLVYSFHLGDADADPTTLFDPQLGDRHEFVRTPSSAWTIPREVSGSGQPWHMEGSLLGLDIGLARFAFRRLSTEPPTQAPRVSSNDRQTFAETVALVNPFDLRDDDQAAIASTIARGRERVAELTSRSQGGDALLDEFDATARLGGWRREAIRWAVRHDPTAVPSFFSLVDLFWLGGPPSSLLERIDRWGVSARPLDGSLVTRFPRPAEWESFAGRPSVGLLATRTPDMMLRVAAALTELQLPARLAHGVAAAAMLDLVDEAPLGHRDDWQAVACYAETVPLVKIQDYVSLLTATGPLIPVANRRGVSRPTDASEFWDRDDPGFVYNLSRASGPPRPSRPRGIAAGLRADTGADDQGRVAGGRELRQRTSAAARARQSSVGLARYSPGRLLR